MVEDDGGNDFGYDEIAQDPLEWRDKEELID